MRWLLDEMLPPATAAELRNLGHDATTVVDTGLGGSDDAAVYEAAREHGRVIVTEDFADYAALAAHSQAADEQPATIVFVRKQCHPRGSALGPALARQLHTWAVDNPVPYPGVHWP
ncbi:MAG: DUF5615 family PIN-like protein [bacterium]|nr:DUF5615 family PIN-like protein [bacterium]